MNWNPEIETWLNQLETFDAETLSQIKNLLLELPPDAIPLEPLREFLNKLIIVNYEEIIPIAEIILNKFNDYDLIKIIVSKIDILNNKNPKLAINITQICLKCNLQKPDKLYFLKQLAAFNLEDKQYKEAVESASQFYDLCDTPSLKAFGAYHVIFMLTNAGYWLEADPIIKQYKEELEACLNAGECPGFFDNHLMLTSYLSYLQDDLVENRSLTNKNGKIFENIIKAKYSEHLVKPPVNRNPNQKLKIGYIAHTLKFHSIGIISRWLIHHHDREKFNINLYLIAQKEDALTQEFFRDKVDQCHNLSGNALSIAQQICDDGIDILVDLDSLTGWITTQVMALKPAPVQATWLGFDASGMPSIDYYIADNYVLPPSAQEYYEEKIWRLPNCYMAIDGIEIGIPSLRRQDLNISDESVIYLTAQTSYKRRPDTIRLQMAILKSVPHSYLLIQGKGGEPVIKELFIQLAQEAGVNPDRLRFTPLYPTIVYRANLSIADVVLDTYPFSGGTTTLDMLWMGLPIVTKVGQQWAARNSYTLMVNAGLSEGIAGNDEEYVEWGIRLGNDAVLRQEIRWKLKKSRRTAPIWNARQFTKDVESAYGQMWEIYQENLGS
ncbi:MAG: hypothetical protein N5P05_002995 [Chroococcopsis gigantea SAG 12.99]|jgi:predicted O-linked N-acetylglucosamine transferase (SPINDLY family)|nr:O-linked N-acetylglucosamine transferase, SPINDLY family protein [Chlorogloea purpurea SAG 13.99]MDV3001389.1 hypothetical protein [Chroococcopsis gigantea SAG 12.99]